jgi:signal transduction histidine kinase
MDDEVGTDLARKMLETTSSIILAVNEELSLDGVCRGIVTSLVEVGELVGAAITIRYQGEVVVLEHACSAGAVAAPELTRVTPVFIRGAEVGVITTYARSSEALEQQSDLLDLLLPTLFLAIDHAISFAEVIDYRNTLEVRVLERTAELAQAREELAASFEELSAAKATRDRFFANINHEIRTPLTMIQLATDGIAHTPNLDPSAHQHIDEVNAATRRLLHLVDSLLVLAAGDEGKLRVKPASLDIAASLQRLQRSWRTAAARGAIEINYAGPDACWGVVDETAIDTIIGNFVSNAMKFTPRGGCITITLATDDTTLTIQVRDTGPGIDPDFIPHLFKRFERSRSAIEKGVRGTGIGLSLAKELVELQHGSIEVVRHDAPTGTSFTVTLPRYQAISAVLEPTRVEIRVSAYEDSQPDRTPTEPLALQKPPEATILLAEDDEALAHHVTQILAKHYRVVTAPNGKVALELAAKHLPDMLVTDLEMPEMDGLELTRRFLDQQKASLAPVLIVSAHSQLGERLAGFDAGAVDFVMKPFSAAELLARIRSQLAIRKIALKLHETQKLASMGMLSAGLAHELRNPANALVNALEPFFALLPPSERTEDSAGTALFQVMDTAATQIRDLCKNILEFSRSGVVVKRPENVRLLVRRAALVLRDRLGPAGFVMQIELEQPVRCSGPLIEQILINLLDNAAFAAGPGGLVSFAARRDNGMILLEVSDTGAGVPRDLAERIFDPFFTTKPVGQGTGLGLSVSRRIALNHGGDLRVVYVGDKSLFRLELPV